MRNTSRRERSNRTAGQEPRARRRRVWGLVVLLAVVFALVLLGLFGRGILAWHARQMAVRELRIGAVAAAQGWLAWAARLAPDDGTTPLLEAACFRQLRQVRPFVRALESAAQKGAPAAQIEQERALGLVQAGRIEPGADRQVSEFIEAGLWPHDVAAAFVCGLLVRGQTGEARKVLDAWAADFPEEAHVRYTTGVYWQWLGDADQAEREFDGALARQPRHEMARAALAELLEAQDRLQEALGQYLAWLRQAPASESARAGLARALRMLGRLDEARAAVAAAGPRAEASVVLAAEMAQIELESGRPREAARWLDLVLLDEIDDRLALRAAATALGLAEDAPRAQRLFARADAAYGQSRRISDLRVRLTIDPQDRAARDEMDRLLRPSEGLPLAVGAPATEDPGIDRHAKPAEPPSETYTLWCAACHGQTGRGDGPAARHLFPRPRDFRTEPFRLASTLNGVPRPEDVQAAIRRGMRGTAMRKFENLSEEQQKLLAEEVLRWNRQGVGEQLVAAMSREGEEIDDDEIELAVDLRTSPGTPARVPPIGPPDPAAAARGKETYLALGCAKCHGPDGDGVGDLPLVDDQGHPTLPRDLVREPFKGGHEPEAIYVRLLVGMPGTPHPSCFNVREDQLADVVQFCREISREPKRTLTNYQRWSEASRRARILP